MSDLMLCGMLRMPLELHLADAAFGPPQLQQRMLEAADELEKRADCIAELERENEALRKDAERFRSLHWHYEQDRDIGLGGRWWTSVSTNDPKIRSNKLAVIDAALKEQSKC